MSGGNQQKQSSQGKLQKSGLADCSTADAGLDVGAIEYIHKKLANS
jgi:ABC-type uncharacterized transport system ATPase subunit